MVFDITNRNTFNALQNWLEDARSLASPHIVILLVGNKKDLESERDVTFLEASQFAQDNGTYLLWHFSYIGRSFCLTRAFIFLELIYMETSAKSGENVDDAFLWCSKNILNKIQTGIILILKSIL